MSNWFNNLLPREKTIFITGLLIVIVFLLYEFAWVTASGQIKQLQSRVGTTQHQLEELQQIAIKYHSLDDIEEPASEKFHGPILSIIDSSSRDYGLKNHIKSLTPNGNNQVRLTFKQADFNNLIEWLTDVSLEAGLLIMQIDVNQADEEGLVDVNLTLARKS